MQRFHTEIVWDRFLYGTKEKCLKDSEVKGAVYEDGTSSVARKEIL